MQTMKRYGILNAQLMRVIAEMGHTDGLVIADVGLPVPLGVERVDMALVSGVPGFIQTLHAIMNELCVEESVIAHEMEHDNPALYNILMNGDTSAIQSQFPEFQIPPGMRSVSHAEFKRMSTHARAVVRTAESTPYANIILFSGVTFSTGS